MYWIEFFSIYPFTQDREDERVALLATVIANISGKALKRPAKITDFLPVYVPTDKPITDPLQRDEYRAFKNKLQDAKGK